MKDQGADSHLLTSPCLADPLRSPEVAVVGAMLIAVTVIVSTLSHQKARWEIERPLLILVF